MWLWYPSGDGFSSTMATTMGPFAPLGWKSKIVLVPEPRCSPVRLVDFSAFTFMKHHHLRLSGLGL